MAKTEIDVALSGLDALEAELPSKPSRVAGLWAATWPKVAAATLALGVWQLVVLDADVRVVGVHRVGAGL